MRFGLISAPLFSAASVTVVAMAQAQAQGQARDQARDLTKPFTGAVHNRPTILTKINGHRRSSHSSMVFLSIGDWGGASDFQPSTAGEVLNGRGMASSVRSLSLGLVGKKQRRRRARFVLALGDNFYTSGIVGNADSQRFQRTFEDVFTEEELDCPWYVVAGNHDHRGNVTAQIEYSKLSPRWRFPDLNYTFTETLVANNGRKVKTQVVYLDTVTLAGMRFKNETTGGLEHEPHPLQSRGQSQLRWLDETLRASTADYLWVAGHYPIYSQCEHGPTDELIADVVPLLKKYKVTGYLSGHDHCLSHFEDTDGMVFVLSGAGRECCYSPSHLWDKRNPGLPLFRMDSQKKPEGVRGGFLSFEVTAESTLIRYHRDDGTTLFQAKPLMPRQMDMIISDA